MSNKRIILFILCKIKKHNLIVKRIKDLLKNCLKEKLRKNSRKIFWHPPSYIKCKLFCMHKIKIPSLWYCFLCTGSLPYGWGEGLATRRPLLRGEHLAWYASRIYKETPPIREGSSFELRFQTLRADLVSPDPSDPLSPKRREGQGCYPCGYGNLECLPTFNNFLPDDRSGETDSAHIRLSVLPNNFHAARRAGSPLA